MSINFGHELVEILGETSIECPLGHVDKHAWGSTGDVDLAIWLSIAIALPLGGAFFLFHRKGKLTCCGKYDPIGVEERIKWLATLGTASYFLYDMLFGNEYVPLLL